MDSITITAPEEVLEMIKDFIEIDSDIIACRIVAQGYGISKDEALLAVKKIKIKENIG